MRTKRTSYDEFMQRIFHRFAAKKGADLVDLEECFDYAEQEEGWKPQRLTPKAIFKRDMSKAISRERIKDADGNPVRPNLALRIKRDGGQGYFHFWGEMLRMKPGQVKMSLQQRLLSIANRAIQLDRDKSYYNDKTHSQIELDYNLNPHVENAKYAKDYPDERPADDAD